MRTTSRKKKKKKRRTVTWKDTLARDLERKWQQRRMMGDNKEVKGNMLLTYPSPDTESACGWAWSEPFLSLPCRTARPLWGPSRTMPGRRSAERLSSWRRHPVDARAKGFRKRSIHWLKHLQECIWLLALAGTAKSNADSYHQIPQVHVQTCVKQKAPCGYTSIILIFLYFLEPFLKHRQHLPV